MDAAPRTPRPQAPIHAISGENMKKKNIGSSDSRNEDDLSLDVLTRDLSRHSQQAGHGTLRCCCGNDDCDSLRRSRSMLDELETQMKIAGSLGQALLRRHESSMADAAARERAAAKTIVELELKASELEHENAATIDENRRLLATLDDINADMAISEGRVRELQEDLDQAHAELSRVSAQAARTAVLEAQLAVLESEQEELQNTIVTTKEEERVATARWKKTERQLAEVEQQLERIDREHTLEKTRSQNILERMEQQQKSPGAVDKNAMGRFMKEILAENGHLQLGVVELRDMLAQSQEEVNALRQKLADLENAHRTRERIVRSSPLSTELAKSPSKTIVHHHHYHAPTVRRPKKKRAVTTPRFTNPTHRWSSSTALSSSPPASSIFDRIDESSRPTSADSWRAPPFPVLHTSSEEPSAIKRSVSHESLVCNRTRDFSTSTTAAKPIVHADVAVAGQGAAVGGSAYNRLLGLQKGGTTPTTKGWFWKYVTVGGVVRSVGGRRMGEQVGMRES